MRMHTPAYLFNEGLAAIGMGVNEFSRIFNVDPRNTRRWRSDSEDIPAWVAPALAALRAPGALDLARDAALEVKRAYDEEGLS